jgi:hypothetical protein
MSLMPAIRVLDPYNFYMDPDPELALFFSCFQDANKTHVCFRSFACLLLTVGLFRSHNTKNHGFS